MLEQEIPGPNQEMLIRSKAAIARLRAYKPPAFPTWDRLPVSRRAAVLVLLYADRRGDLRVVITMRASSLRSFSGTSCSTLVLDLQEYILWRMRQDDEDAWLTTSQWGNRTCSAPRREGGHTERDWM